MLPQAWQPSLLTGCEDRASGQRFLHGYCRPCTFLGRQLHYQGGQDLHKVSFQRGLFHKRTRSLPTVDNAGPYQLIFLCHVRNILRM